MHVFIVFCLWYNIHSPFTHAFMICRDMQYLDPPVIQSRGSIAWSRLDKIILETFDRMGLDMKNVGTLCESVPEKRISFGDVIYMISSSEFLTMTKIVIIILNCIFFSSLTDIGIGYAKNLCA